MPRCEETYPDDPSAQCVKQADPPGTQPGYEHEHKAVDADGWECTWRTDPPPGFGTDQ